MEKKSQLTDSSPAVAVCQQDLSLDSAARIMLRVQGAFLEVRASFISSHLVSLCGHFVSICRHLCVFVAI